MNVPVHNLKPFSAINPVATGAASDVARNLHASPLGEAGRYATNGPPDQHTQLVDQTRTWVAQTFFGTLLKQIRNSPFKSELFSGGKGGEAFGGLQDQRMAEHMARGAGSKLVNGIVRRIEANAAYQKQRKTTAKSTNSVDAPSRADNRTDPRRHDGDAPTGTNPAPQTTRNRFTRSPHVAPALRA